MTGNDSPTQQRAPETASIASITIRLSEDYRREEERDDSPPEKGFHVIPGPDHPEIKLTPEKEREYQRTIFELSTELSEAELQLKSMKEAHKREIGRLNAKANLLALEDHYNININTNRVKEAVMKVADKEIARIMRENTELEKKLKELTDVIDS